MTDETHGADVDGCELKDPLLLHEPIAHLPVATLSLDLPTGHRVTAAWYSAELAPSGDELADLIRYVGHNAPEVNAMDRFMARVTDMVRDDVAADPQLVELRDAGLRARVARRDGGSCRFCGDAVWPSGRGEDRRMIDHVFPNLAIGAQNMVVACHSCHVRRGEGQLLPVMERPVSLLGGYSDVNRCETHHRPGCWACHQNPADCTQQAGSFLGCDAWAKTGMHHSGCPNRVEVKQAASGEDAVVGILRTPGAPCTWPLYVAGVDGPLADTVPPPADPPPLLSND